MLIPIRFKLYFRHFGFYQFEENFYPVSYIIIMYKTVNFGQTLSLYAAVKNKKRLTKSNLCDNILNVLRTKTGFLSFFDVNTIGGKTII